MCVVSMIHDHYKDRFKPWFPELPPFQPEFPWPPLAPPNPVSEPDPSKLSPDEIAQLRELIREFKSALRAAQRVDSLTAQPDCVDPEKAKLSRRVLKYERKLSRVARPAATRSRSVSRAA